MQGHVLPERQALCMLGAFGLRRDDRGDGGNAALYNQLFDGCGSCFHNGRGRSERWGRGGRTGGRAVAKVIEGEP